jgi:hypothetical protein
VCLGGDGSRNHHRGLHPDSESDKQSEAADGPTFPEGDEDAA